MPAAVAAAVIGGIAAGTAITATTITIGFSWAAFGASLALGLVSKALAPKPKTASADTGLAGRTVTLRQPAAPRQVVYGRARVGGTIVWMQARDNAGGDQFLHLAIVLAGHECDAIEEIWFDDYKLQLDADGWDRGRYNTETGSYVLVRKYLGTPGQSADPYFITFGDGKWTTAHRLAGCTYLAVLLTANPDLFPNGIPQISAVVRGRKVYDVRTDLTAWSANSALCARDYLSTYVGVDPAAIAASEAIAAANVCDELVPLAAGGTERRYETNGAFTLDRAPTDVLPDLANAMAGAIIRSGGVWTIEAGAYATPAIILTDDDLRAPERVRTRVSRREGFNAIRGTFVSPSTGWQPDDFPPVRSSVYRAEDYGQEVWKDIELPFTTSAGLAQRLAKIDLLRARQQITVELPCKLAALRVRPGSVIGYTSSFYGWAAKPFRVVGFALQVEEEGGVPRLGVNLQLREIASNVYDWSSSEESAYDPAPNTNLPDPWTISPPGVPVVSEELYETTGSAGVKARAIVTISASGSAFVDAYDYKYQRLGDVEVVLPRTPALMVKIDDIAPGTYDFSARAISQRGVASAWVTRRFEVVALSAPPADVSGLAVIASSGIALANWDLHADLDVRQGGAIVVRHSTATSGATWNGSVPMREFAGNSVSGALPLVTGTYLAKARDSSGNYSPSAASFVASEGMVTGFTTVATSTQSPTFSGTKTGLRVISSELQLGSTATIGSLGLISTWGLISDLGDKALAGTYDFTTYVDLTTGATRRFEADITAAAFDSGDLLSKRTTHLSEWPTISGGGDVNDCSVQLYAALTDDNPAGSPTWSAWIPFHVADFNCRAAKFKMDFARVNPSHNIKVSTLAVDVKVPV